MGSGASAQLQRVQETTPEEIAAALKELPADELKKLTQAIGSSVSADLEKKVQEASPDDLAAELKQLSAEDMAKLTEALTTGAAAPEAAAQPPAAGEAPAEAVGTGTAVAGENEDNVDEALAIELSNQEKLFLKCLRKRAEREEKKKLEKEVKKAADKAKREKAMEAAFDGEVDELLKMFEEGIEPDMCDDHGTTLLSEACASGAQEVVDVLLGEGCDPNSVGRYRRTPLWRAAYGGNHGLIRILLRAGADPRECDEQGARPIDVASNPPSKECLIAWDPASTDRIKEEKIKDAKKAEKEKKAKAKRQKQELDEALEEADRKRQIARSELARARKLLGDYRQQKVSFVEQGNADGLAQMEPLIEGAETQVKLFEASVQEWDWKASRAKLKISDLKQAEKEKAEKAAGKLRGFKVQVVCNSLEELDIVLPKLNKDLEVAEDFTWGEEEAAIDLVKGDTIIKEAEGPWSHLKPSEFNKKVLEAYGRTPPDEEATPEEEEGEKESPFPVTLAFARGFSRTIPIKAVADVLLKDIGGLRAEDGRWPLVIDPSGRTSTFIKYTGATVYTMMELQEMTGAESVRLRRAFLKSLMHGSALLIDLGAFESSIDVLANSFNELEKGLFAKLLDRSVLYSYLLPRRFKSLIDKDVRKDFDISSFLDDAITKFVFGFVTSYRDPDLSFAKQFYTISIKGGDEEDA
eukprot:TRINITY_DN48209_c0_g1_i1.p1 TRINITY_DN48209_c0_g1~~TRINITY_DN48209_c0_g1_i1.p1  ORF type:complete len:694 (+),score=237.02 TRINITY_DN48209_c0_g1_i1:76-2157(+)